MQTAAVIARPRLGDRSVRIGPIVVVVVVCVVAAVAYVWLRVPLVDHVQEGYAETCRGVEGRPTDPFCAVTWRSAAWTVLGSALLAGLGVAVPIAVLAAAGRRWLAVAPIAPALVALPIVAVFRWFLGEASPSGGWWRFGVPENMLAGWPSGRAVTSGALDLAIDLVIDAVLLGAPAVAIALVLRPAAIGRDRIARWPFVFATFICGAGVAMVVWASPRLGIVPDAYGAMGGADGDALTIAGMAAFGAALGTDRRWWPWAVPFVAVLFAGAPALLVAGSASGFGTTMGFGSAVELTAIGLVGSAWRPLASRGGGLADPSPNGVEERRELRPSAVVNALAVSLVVISIVAARNDPLPIAVSTALPTYLGARIAVHDTAARRVLVDALDAADAHAGEAGSYEGFGIRDARMLEPDVSWAGSLPTTSEPAVAIDLASPDLVRVVTISGSGAAVCMQRDGDGATTWSQDEQGGDPADGVAAAVATCGSMPLTPSVTRGIDVASFCDPIADESLLICRSTQRLMRDILAGSAT